MPEQMCILTIDVLFQLELTLLAASVCTFIALARVSLGQQRLVLLVSRAYDHRWLLTGLSESCWLMAAESDGHMQRVVYHGLVRCFRITSVLFAFESQGTVPSLLLVAPVIMIRRTEHFLFLPITLFWRSALVSWEVKCPCNVTKGSPPAKAAEVLSFVFLFFSSFCGFADVFCCLIFLFYSDLEWFLSKLCSLMISI